MNYMDLFVPLKTGPYAHQKPIDRFWNNVNRSRGCWEWTGLLDRAGYGRFSVRDKKYFAHRVSYFLVHGKLPNELNVCHKCDNPCCVRPSHLFLGTHADNVKDMVSKGRNKPPRGEKCGRSKLTRQSVRQIRRRHKAGESQKKLAKEFKVSPKQISVIVNRKQWRHIL